MLCLVLVSATILTVPISGMIGIVGKATAAPEESVLRVGFMQLVDKLNPYTGLGDAAYIFYGLVYDAMQSVGNDLEIVGNLATDCYPVPASDPLLIASGEPYGSVWEYKISQNATWHDGEPFTTEDVVWNMELSCDEANYENMWAYQPYAYFMNYAEALDEETVRIHYYDRDSGEPKPCAYANLICIPMLPKHLLEDVPVANIGFNWPGVFNETVSDYPIVGTGQFMGTSEIYDEFLNENYLTLVKNPNYHGLADWGVEVKFDKLIMKFYDELSALDTALRVGEIDIAQLPPQAYYELKEDVADGLENIDTYDGLRITQYWTEIGINMDYTGGPNPTRVDPAVRKALAMATDKEHIVENYYMGLAEPGTTLISPVNELWHYEPTEDEMIPYDLEAARQLLTDAGYIEPSPGATRLASATCMPVSELWVEEDTPLTYDMMTRNEYPEEYEIAKYLKTEWAKIGVNLNIRQMLEDQLSKECYLFGYDMMIWYWSADVDPNYMLFCEASPSYGGWCDNVYYNVSYEENYSKSVEALDPVERLEAVYNCQRVHYEDVGYIILAYPYQTYAWRTDTFTGWGNWETDPGRSFDHFWTANPLFYDLEYIAPPPDEPVPIWVVLAAVGAIVAVVVGLIFWKKKGKGEKKEDTGGESPLGD